MVYRIRYRSAAVREDREALVEAHSPTAAVVKFRSTCDSAPPSPTAVRSVTPEPAESTPAG